MGIPHINAGRSINGQSLFGAGRPIVKKKEDGTLQIYVNSPQEKRVILDAVSNAGIDGRALEIYSATTPENWRRMQSAVNRGREFVSGQAARLRELNLVPDETYDITDIVVAYGSNSQHAEPKVSVLGQQAGTQDLSQYREDGITVPVIHNEITLSTRSQSAVSDDNVYQATRSNERKLEESFYTGFGNIKVRNNETFGALNHPDRNPVTAPGEWTTISNVIPTIQRMLNALIGDGFEDGSVDLVIPSDLHTLLDTTHYADVGDTPLERINKIERIAAVRPASSAYMSGQAIMFAHDPMTIQYIEEMGTDVMEWSAHHGMTQMFAIITIAAFMWKSNFKREMGLAVASGLGVAPTS